MSFDIGEFFGNMWSSLVGGGQDTHAPDQKWNHLLGPGSEQKKIAEQKKQEDIQREFAQNSIRWRVEDAKRAGIHPLAALGASGASYSPILSVGGDEHYGRAPADPNSLNAMRMGQDFSRAIANTSTKEERIAQKMQLMSAKLDIEGKSIDNAIRMSQLRRMSMTGPGLPAQENFMPGQGNSGTRVVVEPKKSTAASVDQPSQEAGWIPDVGFSRTPHGLAPVIPQGLSESLEDDMIGKFMWRWRNQIQNNFGLGTPPSRSMLPKGYDRWKWNFVDQEWIPWKSKSRKEILRNIRRLNEG